MTPRKQARPVLPGIDIVRQEVYDIVNMVRRQIVGFRIELRLEKTPRWGDRWIVSLSGSCLVCGYKVSRLAAMRTVGAPHGDDIETAVYRAAWELYDIIMLEVPLPEAELFPDLAA